VRAHRFALPMLREPGTFRVEDGPPDRVRFHCPELSIDTISPVLRVEAH
jgi:hypothetical protein